MWREARGGEALMADVDVTLPRRGSPLDEHVVDAINEVLEGERGSVAALVQLSAMATDSLERHALSVTGGQATQACFDLRGVLERHGARVSDQIGEASSTLLELERLDDRYLAFGHLRQQLMERIESIASSELDASAQAVLAMVHTIQSAQAAWALQRARDFTASREEALSADARPTDGSGQSAEGDAHAESRPADDFAALPVSTANGGTDAPLPLTATTVGAAPASAEVDARAERADDAASKVDAAG